MRVAKDSSVFGRLTDLTRGGKEDFMSQKISKEKIGEDIYRNTESELRAAGIDVDYYKQRIPPEQFRRLMEFLSYSAPGNFDPEEFFYPEDL